MEWRDFVYIGSRSWYSWVGLRGRGEVKDFRRMDGVR